MLFLMALGVFWGVGVGGFQAKNEAWTFSLDFGKRLNPDLDVGTKLTMSLTEDAPQHFDIPFYNWSTPSDYPEEMVTEYRERNEISVQIAVRKYLKNFILIGLLGFSMQEYITLVETDNLGEYSFIPIAERDEYFLTFGGGVGFEVAKLDLCLVFSNRYGTLFYVTREFKF